MLRLKVNLCRVLIRLAAAGSWMELWRYCAPGTPWDEGLALGVFVWAAFWLHQEGAAASRPGWGMGMSALGAAMCAWGVLEWFAPEWHPGLIPIIKIIVLGSAGIWLGEGLAQAAAGASWAQRPVILLGQGDLGQQIASELRQQHARNWRLLEWLPAPAGAEAWERLGPRLLAHPVCHLILAEEDRRGARPGPWMLRLRAQGMQLHDGAEWLEKQCGKIPVLAARPAELDRIGIRPRRRRTLSAWAAGVLLALGSPLLALAVWLDAGRPIFFRQLRVGRDGQSFQLYKFRSMRVGSDPLRPAAPGDARCTPLGRWLRRLRLDELPQLWNIWRGEMGWVGPRPFAWEQEMELARALPGYEQRWLVAPGATGWAQIHRGYCATWEDNREKLAYDLYYVKHNNWLMDFLILARTSRVLIQARGGR